MNCLFLVFLATVLATNSVYGQADWHTINPKQVISHFTDANGENYVRVSGSFFWVWVPPGWPDHLRPKPDTRSGNQRKAQPKQPMPKPDEAAPVPILPSDTKLSTEKPQTNLALSSAVREMFGGRGRLGVDVDAAQLQELKALFPNTTFVRLDSGWRDAISATLNKNNFEGAIFLVDEGSGKKLRIFKKVSRTTKDIPLAAH